MNGKVNEWMKMLYFKYKRVNEKINEWKWDTLSIKEWMKKNGKWGIFQNKNS